MEKELNPEVIRATQNSLGKYIKRPPLNEKLLKKPPFRFLHDIVTTVLKTTGFYDGLFEEEELTSDNVKDRDSKILFLNKVITVLEYTTGKSLSVKPSKIVAGQEPDKTNELLQCLAQALDKKLSSDEAVRRYKESTKEAPQLPVEKKAKDQIKTSKKNNDAKKLVSKSSEKLPNSKVDSNDKSLSKNDKDKVLVKSKSKESTTNKKESPPKKTAQSIKSITKKNSIDKTPQNQINQNEVLKQPNKKNVISVNTKNEKVVEEVLKNNNDNNDEGSEVSQGKEVEFDTTSANLQETITNIEQDNQEKFNRSYTIADNDLNSSLSSQDLMEVDNDKTENSKFSENYKDNTEEIPMHKEHIVINNYDKENLETVEKELKSNNNFNGTPESIKTSAENSDNVSETTIKSNVRPTSVRPSSSRPGAPRLRDKHDNVVTGTEARIVGKVNIIIESSPNEEEEEDASLVVVDQLPTTQDHEEQVLSLNQQHGHLVQQILDSQREFSQISGKTEIEWQFGTQKAKEALNQEIEQLRFNIQGLSRVANPLGKLLDHIQEDVEVMRQELRQWTKTYEETSKELTKQKTANEDSLLPLRTKLKQLTIDIEEKHDKINDLKIVIHKNSSRIEKLLAGGNVQ